VSARHSSTFSPSSLGSPPGLGSLQLGLNAGLERPTDSGACAGIGLSRCQRPAAGQGRP
jgi:hypothetical protein